MRNAAVKAGAKFIVSPGFDPEIVNYCLEKEIPIFPGCVTPSEVAQAVKRGLKVVKFFPAEPAGGVAMIKAMAAPYNQLRFMPTGGIGTQNLKDYHTYRKTYLEEYYPDNQVEIDACKRFIATQTTDGSTNTAVSRDNAVSTLISMIDFRDYEEALHFTQENLSQNQDNELFCILTVFLQIYQQETEAGLHEVFLPLENGSQTAGWLPLHYQRICRYIWRIENGLPQEYLDEAHQYFKRWHVSRTAQDRIRILCLPE